MAICGYSKNQLPPQGTTAPRRTPARWPAVRNPWVLLLLGLCLPDATRAAAGPQVPQRLRQGEVFGETYEIESRDLSGTALTEALDAATAALRKAERAARPAEGSVGDLRTAAADALPWRLELLRRAADICVWAGGAHGPLARPLYEIWGLDAPQGPAGTGQARPDPEALRQAAQAASSDCAVLLAELASAPASGNDAENEKRLVPWRERIDLRGFERGYAIDRAAEALYLAGSRSGRVRIGPVVRGFGGGPAGLGWPVVLPRFAGQREAVEPVALQDQALAVAAFDEHELILAGGERLAAHLDQRTGLPATGKVAVLVATQYALDAEALSVALFVLATREGEFRVGGLRPKPSILWLLGSGEGEPLQLDSRWSSLRRRPGR